MKTLFYFLAAFFFFSCGSAVTQHTDNVELQAMHDEDQRARMAKNIDWEILGKQDSIRQVRVFELIREGKIVTAKDYYHSAMIFQHGNDTIASGMAVKQMRKAIELDSTINKWLLAAAIDRDLMRRNKPQIYGTQYVRNGENEPWVRYEIDTTQVTDEERKYYEVETLAEQKIKERDMNLLSVSDYYTTTNSIDQTIAFMSAEKKKGSQSTYNVSEIEINNFGYELMLAEKNEEALKVFKLNTALYPDGFNTFDSYGECLLKLGRKKEALQAYRKSLDLNPKNDNARKILEDIQ